MRYTVKISYSGAGFCGWQKQPSDPSVQENLEAALGKLLGAETPVIGAGRTDTGVNAIGYVACFDGPEGLVADDFCYKLNAILPHSVVVSGLAPAAPDFHPRYDAVKREYTYFIHRSKDPFVEAWSWQCGYPGLDFEAMNRAAEFLVGTHDFSSFEKKGGDNKTSICTVSEARWVPYVPTYLQVMGSAAQRASAGGCGRVSAECVGGGAGAGAGAAAGHWYFRISADRFLRNMVRAIVGTLIDVGRGKRSIDDFAGLILPPDENSPKKTLRRSLAGESVPGHALFLSSVEY